ncbi:MAG: PAS domain S-box protein [Cyanobacteriota bacterium]|nr:PAS domain S-box protein [Cyanobacteriota bacterium]
MPQTAQLLQKQTIQLESVNLKSRYSKVLYIDNRLRLPQWMESLNSKDNDFGLNWHWTHVQSLEAGLNALKSQSFDAIAVRLFLPDSQGLETLNQLRAVTPNLPIIMVSRTTPKELNLARQCLQNGATDYWLKPSGSSEILYAQELLVRILRNIEERQQTEQKSQQCQTALEDHQLFEQHLRTTQTQIQGFLEAINDTVLILDADANQIQVVPTHSAISEPKATDILHHTLNLLADEEHSQFLLEAIARSLTHQTTVNVEYSLTISDQQLWFTAHISPLSEEQAIWVARDITQRKQTEEQLRESQKFLQLVMDNIPQHIFWKDRDSVYLGCNQNFAKVAGLESPKQIIGKTDYDLPWTTAEADAYRKDDRQVMDRDRAEYHIIETQLTAEGKQVWLDTNKIPLHNRKGDVIGILGTYEDITDRRLIEAWLELTQFTLDHAGDGIFLVNAQGQLFYVNEAACQQLECTREQLLNLTIEEIDPTLTQSIWKKYWRKVKKQQTLTHESIHRTQQGREFPVEVNINYLEFNNQAYSCVIARDISDRKQAENQLQQQFTAIEAAIDGIALLKDGQYVYLNPAHVKLFGYNRPEELIGQSWTTLYNPSELERFQRDVFPALGENQAWRGEAIATRKDGSTFPEEVSLTLAPDGTLICVCRDITQRKQAEREIFKALEKEQELNQLKSRFITLMSHEFRTPLAVISSSAGILETFNHKLSEEKRQKHIQKIQTQIQHSIQLLDEILLINQAETNQLVFDPQPLDLVDFCQKIIAKIQQSNDNHSIELSYPQDHQEIPVVMDQTLLQHILTELLSNAIKYSPDEGKIDLRLSFVEDNVCFQVQDRGIGIPPTDREHLFESFYRAENVGNIQGTGLGLSIIKQCIDSYGGEIIIESGVNQGTTVTIALPTAREQSQ